MTDEDTEDTLVDSVADMMSSACKMVALAKDARNNVSNIVYVDANGNDAVLQVYGYKLHTWTASDTFDRLAVSELQDANLAPLIAYYNGIANETEIEAGAAVKIPILQADAATGGAIYTIPGERDNYGTDITLDDGDIAIDGQDVRTISGAANLSQNIALRLATAVSKRIRLASYGIRSTIGSVETVSGYLLASIEQTVSSDPRVKSVDKVTVRGEGDKLFINVDYTDINGSAGNAHTAA